MQRNLIKDVISILSDEPSLTTSLIFFFFSGQNSGHTMPSIGFTSAQSVCTCQYSVRVDSLYDNNRHFSVTPYITICPSTETYFGLYLRGAMSAVTGIYLFCLLLNIIFLS